MAIRRNHSSLDWKRIAHLKNPDRGFLRRRTLPDSIKWWTCSAFVDTRLRCVPCFRVQGFVRGFTPVV